MALIVPNLIAKMVDASGLLKSQAWISFFQQFVNPPSPIASLIVGASPFIYIAREPGLIIVTGGIVSAQALIRGLVIINITGIKLIPVEIKDSISVTYTGLPTMQFMPRY